MSLTDADKKWLKDLTRTSVDDARVSIDCREQSGRLMTVEECEYCLSLITPSNKTLWKLFEAKARRAFRASVRGDRAYQLESKVVAHGKSAFWEGIMRGCNYPTLRKALYLATEPAICERIRSEIKTRFPWGSFK